MISLRMDSFKWNKFGMWVGVVGCGHNFTHEVIGARG